MQNVDLDLEQGVVGLLGPNGAGKTTLMSLLNTNLSPKTGSIIYNNLKGTNNASLSSVRSKDLSKIRKRISFLPQKFSLMRYSKLIDNVEYAAWARCVPAEKCHEAAVEALKTVDLLDRANSRAKTLSGGMIQRLGIACAISNRPQILLLDEPTVGIDPEQRMFIRDFLNEYSKNNIVLMSTHLVEDLTIAKKMIVMDKSRVKFVGSLDEFLENADSEKEAFVSPLESAYRNILNEKDDNI
ncbi:MAG: ATP-binding cassette domain-containing protein [Candidatus Ancillula sp.]|nr:ATP-binding cassette domain-containing protein [Candidatus Ancillula sp.]